MLVLLLTWRSGGGGGTAGGGRLLQLHSRLRLWGALPSYCYDGAQSGSNSSTWSRQTAATQQWPAAAPVAVHPGVIKAFMVVHRAAQAPLGQAQAIWSSSSANSNSTTGDETEVLPIIQAHINATAIAAAVGDYPLEASKTASSSSSSRGVVLVGGGPAYTPPAYACIVFLRRTGSRLPVEVWVPPHHLITPAAEAEFVALGNVRVRDLGDAFPQPAAHEAMRRCKFLAKPLAIMASAFREVLALDADNLPLRDPAFLFDDASYASTGLLMWPDFWRSEVKPDGWAALNIPGQLRPPGSHESGQVLIDKRRAWQPLLLATYFNLRGDVFYPLFSDNGQGDKESLPLAWLALGRGEYGLVKHPVMALGTLKPDGSHAGSAMLQRAPDGGPVFLHAHLPKVDMPGSPPGVPPAAPRSWQVMTGEVGVLPPGVSKGNASTYVVLNAVAGVDIEAEVQRLRRQLRCRPAWVHCCLRE